MEKIRKGFYVLCDRVNTATAQVVMPMFHKYAAVVVVVTAVSFLNLIEVIFSHYVRESEVLLVQVIIALIIVIALLALAGIVALRCLRDILKKD